VAFSLFRWLVLLTALLACVPALAKTQNISGRIVAYESELVCTNGNGYWWMAIRVEKPVEGGSEFIQVQFSQPCGITPKWLTSKSSIQKFHLIRVKEFDAVLEEFLPVKDESNHDEKQDWALPRWTHVPGAEQEALPFGHMVPGYRSKDLPLAPIF
jgi:hypothetical protein